MPLRSRPHLEYAAPVWSPYSKQDINVLENVQRRATKVVAQIKNLPYEERLRMLGLTKLVDRRIRGDLILLFKIKNGFNKIDLFCDVNPTSQIFDGPANNTRGHNFKLSKQSKTTCNQREHFFTNRIVTHWNNLPQEVVQANSINQFKARLDKYLAGPVARP